METTKEILAMLGRVAWNLVIIFSPLIIVMFIDWVDSKTKP
jgi:hypothetical protein